MAVVQRNRYGGLFVVSGRVGTVKVPAVVGPDVGAVGIGLGYTLPRIESQLQVEKSLIGRHGGRGFWKLPHRLRKNGLRINLKRTLRAYRAMGLNLSRRRKKRLPTRIKQLLAVPTSANVCWSLDFTSDVLIDGRRFRPLNVLADYNRQLLRVAIDFYSSAARLVQVLMCLVECHDRRSCAPITDQS